MIFIVSPPSRNYNSCENVQGGNLQDIKDTPHEHKNEKLLVIIRARQEPRRTETEENEEEKEENDLEKTQKQLPCVSVLVYMYIGVCVCRYVCIVFINVCQGLMGPRAQTGQWWMVGFCSEKSICPPKSTCTIARSASGSR